MHPKIKNVRKQIIKHTQLPVLTDEFKGSARNSGHNTTTLGFSGGSGFSAVVFLNPNHVYLKNVGCGDNEVGKGSDLALGGPLRLEIIGLNWCDLGREIGAAVGDEAGGAVLDSGGPVHHLVGCVTHGRMTKVCREKDRETTS